MTIQQKAYEKIMKLPEDGIKLILVMADKIARQHGNLFEPDGEINDYVSLTRKKKHFKIC